MIKTREEEEEEEEVVMILIFFMAFLSLGCFCRVNKKYSVRALSHHWSECGRATTTATPEISELS